MAKLNKELEKIQDTYKEAEAAEGGGKRSKLKNGDYKANISEMKVELSKNSGRLQVMTEFKVVSPEKSEGKTVRRFDGLNETGMPYFKAMCEKIGLELPKKAKDIPAAIEEFLEEHGEDVINIGVVTKDEFTNVYVNDGDDDDDDDDDDSDDDSDDGDNDGEESDYEKSDDDDSDDDDDDEESDDDDDDDETTKKKKGKKVKKEKKAKKSKKDKKKKKSKKR